MSERGGLRRRAPKSAAAAAAATAAAAETASREETRHPSPETSPRPALPSWRFAVRWTARVLLVLVLVLASANVVRIPDGGHGDGEGSRTLLLVMAHARPEYLRRCLDSILKYHPTAGTQRGWPLVVSLDLQDGEAHEPVALAVEDAQSRAPAAMQFDVWRHANSYRPDVPGRVDDLLVNVGAYRRISRHYEWALRRAFELPGVDRVVVVEDDMEVAPDFFLYFDALSPLLDADPTLLCISAWNDNGKESLAVDPEQLHRTDFFPGLGWMLSRSLWSELDGVWPELYWDDWLRSSAQVRGRQCIRPEVSRTANFGANGVSQSFNHEKHVSQVVLNRESVNFSALDLGYLDPGAYERLVFGRMSSAVLLKYSNYLTSRPQDADVIARHPEGSMDLIGKRTGVMTDHRDGVFRTSYRGVVIIPWNGHWAFLVARGWEPPPGYSLGARVCCN
jgi:alpha-1,3-mannosyl-glycoprotein beta-1,2-N-acetylglucosaminyltransferase